MGTSQEITTITLPLPLRMGTVNCYLVGTEAGTILIDTGPSSGRAELEAELQWAGCAPDTLKLVLLTHGDFDHIGNAAYLRRRYGPPVGMHRADVGMAERGDMFWNRTAGNVLIRGMAPVLYRFGKSNRFRPDLFLDEEDDLAEYGVDARILHLPGHSLGSIGVMTALGDLFCGDLLEMRAEPSLNSLMDDAEAAQRSVEKLRGLDIGIVYPGHGGPFPMELFTEGR
jgi:glyoxylase-like metal-dependent hydrolase (beta-lactamase superfamily II)